MMHFKKNLLAEYKGHGSDESFSPPSSPSSTSTSYSFEQHEIEASGSVRKATLRRSSSKKSQQPSSPQQDEGEPSQSDNAQGTELNYSVRIRKIGHQMSPSESNYHSPAPSSPDLSIVTYDEDMQHHYSSPKQKRTTSRSFQSTSPSHSFESTSSSTYSATAQHLTGLEANVSPQPPLNQRKRRKQRELIPANCPLRRCDIVDLPIDEFNSLMEEKNFTEDQKLQFKEWRRKGKNRVAARKSREKRLIGIEQLKVARDKKIKQLKCLDKDFSKLEKERLNLMRAVQTFAQHFA